MNSQETKLRNALQQAYNELLCYQEDKGKLDKTLSSLIDKLEESIECIEGIHV